MGEPEKQRPTLDLAAGMLDPSNNDHWTQDGLPRLDALSSIVGREVTRKEVTESLPDLRRVSLKPSGSDDSAPVVPDGLDINSMSDDEIGQISVERLATDEVLLEKLIALQESRAAEAMKVKSDAESRLERLYRQVSRLSVIRERFHPDNSQDFGEQNRRFIAQQHKNRKDRADRLEKVIGATGSTPQELARATATKSPIDAALGARPKPNQRRPAFNPATG